MLGAGFVEKVYENALAYGLRKAGMNAYQQRAVDVIYDGVVIGSYFADFLVEDALVVKLKAVKALDPAHTAQGLNYLRATGLPLCLLLNFGVFASVLIGSYLSSQSKPPAPDPKTQSNDSETVRRRLILFG